MLCACVLFPDPRPSWALPDNNPKFRLHVCPDRPRVLGVHLVPSHRSRPTSTHGACMECPQERPREVPVHDAQGAPAIGHVRVGSAGSDPARETRGRPTTFRPSGEPRAEKTAWYHYFCTRLYQG